MHQRLAPGFGEVSFSPVNLEDHLGDIIRKARSMNTVSAAAASRAAGISESELSTLEETGNAGARRIALAPLATAVGLNAQKLEAIAKGWAPSPKDLGIWRELRVFTTAYVGMTVNCYLAWDEVTREA